jgi:hypothetical protein
MNKEFLGDRRRALEEEYFAKLNRTLLDRLRAGEAADVKSDDAASSPISKRKPSSDRDAKENSRGCR